MNIAETPPKRAGQKAACTQSFLGYVRVVILALVLPIAVASCGGTAPSGRDAPARLVSAKDPVTGEEIVTTQKDSNIAKFFSRHNLRETVFSGNTSSRLAGAPGTTGGGFLNLNAVNNGPDGARQGNGSAYGNLTTEEIIIDPIKSQPIIGGQWQPEFNNSRTVTLNYTDEPLEAVVQNILGGILGANYITGDNLEGTLTFRSERRFARTELVQVLSDVLARNGYLIQYFNGVYHIGLPEELETLTGLRNATNTENDARHVIRLRREPSEDLVGIVSALVPPGNSVSQVPGTNNILVRGDPANFASIEDLVVSLVRTGSGKNHMAIIPTRNSPPETVAEQILIIYQERGIADILVMPVDATPGILVVADDPAILTDVQNLVRSLDVENRDAPQVRVIQLKHLQADDLAGRLSEIYEGTGVPASGSSAASNEETSNILAAAVELANAGNNASAGNNNSAEGGDNLPVPRFLRGAVGRRGSTPNNAGSDSTQTVAGGSETRAAAPVTFSADSRNNALLVRSRFAEFKKIRELVHALDVPLAQVVIEATIVEVDINDSLQYGVQAFLQVGGLALRSSDTTAAASPSGGGFTAVLGTGFGGTSIQAVITALQSATNVRVISSPYLTVVDGASSRLAVGDQIPFITASQTSNSSGTVTVTQEVEARDIGVILDVTPRISPDNTVFLDITQQVSAARNVATVAGTNPIISQRTVTSQITVASGETVLLGGLIQERDDNSENGIPVVRQIPVIGNVFNRRENTQTRSELLVMITPRVVRNSDSLSSLTQQLKVLSAVNR